MDGVDVFGDEVGEGEDFYGGEEGGEELEGGWGGEEAFVKHFWRGIVRVWIVGVGTVKRPTLCEST